MWEFLTILPLMLNEPRICSSVIRRLRLRFSFIRCAPTSNQATIISTESAKSTYRAGFGALTLSASRSHNRIEMPNPAKADGQAPEIRFVIERTLSPAEPLAKPVGRLALESWQ